MNDKNRGLYHKYNVFKDATGEAVTNCIVLKFDDPIAREAIRKWADAMELAGFESCASETRIECDVYDAIAAENSREEGK